MPTGSMASYLDYQLFPLRNSPEFEQALGMIRATQALDLDAAGETGFSFHLLLQALLFYSVESKFLRYDPLSDSILLKQFSLPWPLCQYNPFRDPANRHAEGQKASPVTASARPDFLDSATFPANEHYLVHRSASGRRYAILVQPVPIFPGHLIIASLDKNPASGSHYGQYYFSELAPDMEEIIQRLISCGYAMGYNDCGAGASVPHYHTQAVPQGFLPVISQMESGRLTPVETAAGSGFSLFILPEDYPVPGLLISSPTASGCAEAYLRVLEHFQKTGLIYNLIAWKSEVGGHCRLMIPRGKEELMGGAFKGGYVEVGGMLIIPQKSAFEQIQSADQAGAILSEAGLPRDKFNELQSQAAKLLSA